MIPATCNVNCPQNAMQVMLVILIWGGTFSNYEEPIQTFCLAQIWVSSQQGVPIVPKSAELIGVVWLCLQLVTIYIWKKKKKEEKITLISLFFYTRYLATLCSPQMSNKLTTLNLGSFNTIQKRGSCLLWLITTLSTKYHFRYNLVGISVNIFI